MQLSVVILAAGQGKRMKSELPKVLQPLAGKPLLRHVVDTARALNPDNITVVYGHGGAQVQAALGAEGFAWAHQARTLGTGHAVMQAMPGIADDHLVLVLYGDVPLIQASTLRRLIAAASPDAMAVLCHTMADPQGYGRIVRDARGGIMGIVEHHDATPQQREIREVNTGLMAIPAQRLRLFLSSVRNSNAQGEYYLTDIVAAALREGCAVNAVVAQSEAEVMGVNDKVQLAQVEAAYRQRRATELMIAGATLADPSRIDIRGDIELGADVFIDVNAVLIGKIKLGARVSIGPNCYIRDAQIGADTHIHPNCVIDGAIIGEHCQIGPFARLRPETVLHHDVHIGNFVEIKKSEIGSASKANHLSYIGDASLGKDVNVGAGTITCNYDGANKWPTVIEDGAFIGSGSMLVAPVRVGSGATIGAGSTITRAAPAGILTLERSKQTSIKEWERPAKLSDDAQQALIDRAHKKD
jgi:bifunctional UDP-N-acetylglucosamine pyrophosphorylase / glucosamine-1-phosphate N-acetyltransferase